MTSFVSLAALCGAGSLESGIGAMAHRREIGQCSSAQRISMRFGFQGLALALIVIAPLAG